MVITLFLIAFLLLFTSVLLWAGAIKKARSERLMKVLNPQQHVGKSTHTKGVLQRSLLRAGLKATKASLFVVVCAFVLAVLVIYFLLGLAAAFTAVLLMFFAVKVLVEVRQRQHINKMVKQFPVFIDHIIRSLKSGRTLSEGLEQAVAASSNPLKSTFERSQRFVSRGASLEEAIGELAELYRIKEFQLLALAVQVNQKYGGNAVEVLSQLVSLIQERDKAARQLRAMTGETRVSALVLGLLPVSLAAYVFISSPDFFYELWQAPSGKSLLFFAFLFQVIGSLTLWRMLRSVS